MSTLRCAEVGNGVSVTYRIEFDGALYIEHVEEYGEDVTESCDQEAVTDALFDSFDSDRWEYQRGAYRDY